MVCNEVWRSSSRRNSANKKRPRLGMKRVLDELAGIKHKVDELAGIKDQVDELRRIVLSGDSDYGQRLRQGVPTTDLSVVPLPLRSESADSILRSFEECLGREAGARILEDEMKEWLAFANLDKCNFRVSFSGNKPRPGKRTKNLDFSIVLKGESSGLEMHTGAVFSLLSNNGSFNSNKELGSAAHRAIHFISKWRSEIIVGLTNGILIEWFSLKNGSLKKRSPICSFRESLCSVLVAEPSSIFVSAFSLHGFNVSEQLGTGRTSSVFKADWEGQEVAIKVYKAEYALGLEHEACILVQFQGIQGVPTLVRKDTVNQCLLMTPIGTSLSLSKSLQGWAHVFPQLVDILQSVHARGIIHRDIRPANILIVGGDTDAEQQVVLIDWGFAGSIGKMEIFAGSVKTGSDRVLEELNRSSTSPAVQTAFDSSLEQLDTSSTSPEQSKKIKEHRSPSTSESGRVVTRSMSKVKASVTKQGGVYCSLGPEDDLVSLVRTFLLLINKGVNEKVKYILHDDYRGYLRFWHDIMADRVLWKQAEDRARKIEYERVKESMEEIAKVVM